MKDNIDLELKISQVQTSIKKELKCKQSNKIQKVFCLLYNKHFLHVIFSI